jgi:hypothetical protein
VIGAAAADHDSDHMQNGLTAVSNLLVTKNNPSSQAPMLLLQTSEAAQASWARLHCSVFGEHPWRIILVLSVFHLTMTNLGSVKQ